ncbi:hypothetical protein F4803DRAFT_569998 [Xylaria telfairii]|nr:hypothetical protein F4803DRAFT_569998 [Xylaria telfairii]
MSITSIHQQEPGVISEAYKLATYMLDQYRGTSVCCRYEVPPGLVGAQDHTRLKSTVNDAILRTVMRHLALWVQLDTHDMRHHIEWRSIDQPASLHRGIQEIIEPGWRVVPVLNCREPNILNVIFTWDHSHIDGIGGKFIPATEQFITLPMSVGYLMKVAWDEEKPSMLRNKPEQAVWAPICTPPRKTRICSFTPHSNTSSNIPTACREHNTTMTGLLHRLALLSLSLRIKEKYDIPFEGATPVNLRPFLHLGHPKYRWLVPERTINAYEPQSLPSDESLSAELLSLMWTISSTVRGEIEQKLKLGLKNGAVGPMNSHGDGWTNRGAQFSLSAETTSAAIMISPIIIANEQLCVAGSWQECIMEKGRGEQIMGDLHRWLAHIGSKS